MLPLKGDQLDTALFNTLSFGQQLFPSKVSNLSLASEWFLPGISGDLVVKNKLPPQSGSSLEAVEPDP